MRIPRRVRSASFLLALVVPAALLPQFAGARAKDTSGRGTDPVIVAAGDIACDPTNPLFRGGSGTSGWCRAAKTAAIVAAIGPTAVLPLGDAQYDTGRLRQYRASYRLSWGVFLSKSFPTPGNHDYEASSTASGYLRYFGNRATPPGASANGYYSYNVGTWHLISLNSNCTFVGCGSGSAQYQWLKGDLQSHPQDCTLAYWHAPRFSSGPHGNTTSVQPFWNLLYRYGAEVVLNGHDHIYERFAPQNAAGAKDTKYGLREFIVGTGGAQHYWIDKVKPHSLVRNTKAFGVLRMALHSGGYGWSFRPVAGATFKDSGTGTCHGRPA